MCHHLGGKYGVTSLDVHCGTPCVLPSLLAGMYKADQCLLCVSQEKGVVLKLFFSLFRFTEHLISLCWCKFGYTENIREPLVTACLLQLFSLRGQLLGVAWHSFGSGSCSTDASWTDVEPLPRVLQTRSTCSHGALLVDHPVREVELPILSLGCTEKITGQLLVLGLDVLPAAIRKLSR